MALPDSLKLVKGTALVFSNSGEYSPTDAGQPTGTDANIDLQSLGTTPDYRQSVKLDLGSANLDTTWEMKAYIEWHSPPAAGGTVEFYLGWSGDVTPGEDNPGNLSGTDVAYNGYGAAAVDAKEAAKQLDLIGLLVCTADTDIQVATVGRFIPRDRYCCLVVANNSSVVLCNTDAIETAVVIYPMTTQIQD